jgi:2-polyprenyl-3-methyl-5-hydroxy-6-metoxy-1,4-benzoquinol methylase
MMSFQHRSYQKELLDGGNIPFVHIRQNMRELDSINHYLGGHRITLSGLKTLLKSVSASEAIDIVEIGSGGGDNLRVIKEWARHQGRSVVLTGIDFNEECTAYAQSQPKNMGIRFIHSDYREVLFPAKPHVIFSSLFCHHFSDDELVFMLQWMQQNTQLGFFINDLHRHPLAYYSIKGITQLLSQSYLVKNDAPLSVQRGFIKEDWERLFAKAGIAPYNCRWKWAFRWLVTYLHPHDYHEDNI